VAPQAALPRDRPPGAHRRTGRRDGAAGHRGIRASSRVHTTRLLSLSEDLPVVVIIIDAADRVREFLPQLDELVEEGMVILDEVEVIRYVGCEP
jgi:PII-like signaling protein